MNHSHLRKLLALFLALVMCLSFFPLSAFAEEPEAEQQEELEELLPEEPEIPEVPEVPEEPETPETPEEPETPETPEEPEVPEVPEEPEVPEVPADPETPEAPEEPEDGEMMNGLLSVNENQPQASLDPAPTNVHWYTDGDSVGAVGTPIFTAGKTSLYRLVIYLDDKDGVFEARDTFKAESSFYLQAGQLCDASPLAVFSYYDRNGDNYWENGTYFFSVNACEYDEEANELIPTSETAVSGGFTYTDPGVSLGTPTNLKCGGKTVTWTWPEANRNLIGGYVAEVFKDGEWCTEICQLSSQFNANTTPGRLEIPQWYGDGTFSVKLRVLSKNFLTVGHCYDWSDSVPGTPDPEPIPEFLPKDVNDQLLDILNNEAAGADTIRNSVQQLGTDALMAAMQADQSDSGAVKTMAELETRLGGSQVSVSPEMSQNFPAEEVKVVGAALNTPESEGAVTLTISTPSTGIALPEDYNNPYAVTFSMGLNVTDPGNLQVPVKVTLPVPDGIDPAFLTVLHYHDDNTDPDIICPHVFTVNGKAYASFVLTGFSDFAFVVDTANIPEPEESVLKFSQDYLLLVVPLNRVGVSVMGVDTIDEITWEAIEYDEYGYERKVPDGIFVIEPDYLSDHRAWITANRKGTYMVKATVLSRGKTYCAYCRVDATEYSVEESLLDGVGVRLMDPKATVELYKTDYTRIRVDLELKNNLAAAVPVPQPERFDRGIAIEKARFADPGLNGVFELHVVDDRTLEIVPTNGVLTGELSVAGSYKNAAIELKFEDSSTWFPVSGTLTLTVKKTMPKIGAKAVKLNSFFADTQGIVFTGGVPKKIELDGDKAAPPTWLEMEYDSYNETLLPAVKYTGTVQEKGTKSGKLNLLVQPEGWALKIPVTVSVSAASTAPKVAAKTKTLSVKAGTNDVASTILTVTPAVFANEPVVVSRILEKTEERGRETLRCEVTDGILTVSPGSALDTTAARTFTVKLSAGGVESGSVTVKTLPQKNAVSMSMKISGAIDLSVPGSFLTAKLTVKNFHLNTGEDIEPKITCVQDRGDYTGLFDIDTAGVPGQITVRLDPDNVQFLPEQPETKTFLLQVTLDTGGDKAMASAVFALKKSAPAKVMPSVTLKASGAIDTIRPATAVTLTPTFKNYYGELSAKDLKFKILEGRTDVTEEYQDDIPFNCEYRNGAFVLTRNLESSLPLGYFKVQAYLSVDYKDANGEDRNFKSKLVTVNVKTGSVKFNQDVKTVTLDRYDANDYAVVHLTPVAGLSEIFVGVSAPMDKNGMPLFIADYRGNGNIAIRYKDGAPVGVKSATVKIDISLEGSTKSKPDAVISVKVNIA